LLATDLTVSTTPLLLPLRLAGVERVDRLRELALVRFAPLLDARVLFRADAVLAPEDFLVPELLRADDLVDDDFVAVDRFALLFAAFPAISTAHLHLTTVSFRLPKWRWKDALCENLHRHPSRSAVRVGP
jgi:hypothetical protein